jgi:hypothetical protein
MRAPSWSEWGCWYEAHGDYGHAAAAYGQAYQEQQNPTLAYEAGVDSERAGDMTQALGYYAMVLSTPFETPSQRSSLQKGNEL